MWKRVPIVRLAGAAVAMLLAVSLAPARADGPSCSLSDLGQAAQDTYNDFLGQCATQFADPYYYPVLGAIGVAATTQQGKDFCHAIIDLDNQIKSAQSQYASAKGDLQTLLKYLPQSVQDEIQNSQLYNDLSGILTSANSIASSLSEAVGILVCACKAVTSSGLGELGSAVGSCADAAFCWLGLSSGCDCGNPPANVYVDCADISFPKPGDPDYFGSTVPRNALPDYGSDIQQFGDYLCYGCESYYGCVSHTFCYCPKPMVFKPGNMEWAGWDHYWECDCPDGSYKAGSGALARVCLWYSINAPINSHGTWPTPPPKFEPGLWPAPRPNAACASCGQPADLHW